MTIAPPKRMSIFSFLPLSIINTVLIIGQEGYITQFGENKYFNNLKDLVKLIQSNKLLCFMQVNYLSGT